MVGLVGVVTALDKEVKPFLDGLKDLQEERGFFYGFVGCTKFACTVSDCGKMWAAAETQHLISLHPPLDYLIHFGVAGGLDDSLEIGSIVIPYLVKDHDIKSALGEPGNHQVFLLNRYTNYFRRHIPTHVEGTSISGDRDIADPLTRKKLRREYNAKTADWESYAVAAVCEKNHVPCVVLRAVSDKADGSASERNLVPVVTHLAEEILRVLMDLEFC